MYCAVKIVEYRVKFVEYQVKIVEYQVKIVEYRVKIVEYWVKQMFDKLVSDTSAQLLWGQFIYLEGSNYAMLRLEFVS